ncbi:MAG: hypothetical protein M0R06_26140 [Sphaerochaeta sp.]|jgi:hypothetical protein|nr:hypothetical protein [Sphaerochaeta sp.]
MSRADDMVKEVVSIIQQYGGVKLTVRQIYYRLVAKQVLVNRLSSYQYLVKLLVSARKEGKIEYTDIEDRTRTVHLPPNDTIWMPGEKFNTYLDYIKKLDESYTLPKWYGQPVRPIVIVEKQALQSVFQNITDLEEVELIVNRGYPSLTLMYELSKRLEEVQDREDMDVKWKLIYYGDYDPSGIDIERHVGETLANDFDVKFDIYREAITRKQIADYNIPPAPAKTTDSRYQRMLEETGEAMQVELDAIEPNLLQDMIRQSIRQFYSADANRERNYLINNRRKMMKRWVEEAFNPDFEKPDNDTDWDD